MKLRIYGNSIRFRLSRTDVAQLDETGMVMDKTTFGPDDEFSWVLRVRPGIEVMRAAFNGQSICVEIPGSLVHDWRFGQMVGLRQSQPIGTGAALEILVEKDFECLEKHGQDPNVLLYPNPNQPSIGSESAAGN